MFGMRGTVRAKGMANMDVKRVREDFPILGQQVHGHPLVYLDNSATTQVPEQVLSTVAEHYRTSNANVHRGMHYLAHASTDALERARGRRLPALSAWQIRRAWCSRAARPMA